MADRDRDSDITIIRIKAEIFDMQMMQQNIQLQINQKLAQLQELTSKNGSQEK